MNHLKKMLKKMQKKIQKKRVFYNILKYKNFYFIYKLYF